MGKKSHNNIQPTARPQVKYQFIREQSTQFPARVLCEVLEVSESGYYAWRKREQLAKPNLSSKTLKVQADEALVKQLREIFENSRQTYGRPRLHKANGVSCSRRRVARLMRSKD